MYYYQWQREIHPDIMIIPIELAGKGVRQGEPGYDTFDDMVDDVYTMIASFLNDSPIAFYGHSMGALVLYELCRRYKVDQRHTKAVIFSGIATPLYYNHSKSHKLPDNPFYEYIVSLGGVSEDVDRKEFITHFMPLIRHDFQLIETQGFQTLERIIESEVAVFSGREDEFTIMVNEWKHCLSVIPFSRVFPGGHFFLHSERYNVIKEIEAFILK
ncbi:thioesterase [Paenibacillus sp. FSL H7-689]|nr:thioesterase [Paenibacillus sp. FSL H7-689]